MKVLNIHGYNGSNQNTNFKILEALKPVVEVISPQFDYITASPDYIEKCLVKLVEDNDIELVVATSFGAFFGRLLSIKYNIPIIATNPCLRPDISLKAIAPEYFNEHNSRYIEETLRTNSCKGYEGDVFILGSEDEVIDHDSITRVIAKDATFYTVSGNHHLKEDEYRDILIKEVVAYETRQQCFSACRRILF